MRGRVLKGVFDILVSILVAVVSTGLAGISSCHSYRSTENHLTYNTTILVAGSVQIPSYPIAEVGEPPAQPSSCPDCRQVAIDEEGQLTVVPNRVCTDRAGIRGVFDFVVFSSGYHWQKGQSESLYLNGEKQDLKKIFETPTFGQALRGTHRIVVLGVASCGGYTEKPERQIELAAARGNWLKTQVENNRGLLPEGPRAMTDDLCLGAYKDGCVDGDRQSQRPVLLIAIRRELAGLNLKECLEQEFLTDPHLAKWRFLAESYDPGFSGARPDLECR